jgi:hypothetical protein
MVMYWGSELDAVARRFLYLKDIQETQTAFEVHAMIESFRNQATIRPPPQMPV